MTTARRAGILGGTFDPIHAGHLDAGHAAAHALGLTEIVIVPASVPPHRPQPIASPYHRFAMAALAASGRPGWRLSDVELLRAPATSFTTTTLRLFHEDGYTPRELFFITGADAFADIAGWRGYPAILDLAHFVVVSRPGHPAGALAERLPALRSRMLPAPPGCPDGGRLSIFLIEAVTADVSATAIRARCLQGRSIAGMVAPAVQQHIEQHRLYTSKAPDRRDGERLPTAGAGRLHGEG